MKKSQTKAKKQLFISSLLKKIRKDFLSIKNKKNSRSIKQADCLSSALSMFSLKSPSLLSFDKEKLKDPEKYNLKTLFGVTQAPCDTYMREVLDEISPRDLRKSFLTVFHEAQRGKLLEQYKFLGTYLCLVDGTEIFNSEKIHCENCCTKKHRDGRITYHHQILGAAIATPNMKQVIPLCPEPIIKQDGNSKNDCERNSLDRFLKDLKKEHPRLKLTIVSDALSANAPHVNKLKKLRYNFIINVKHIGNKTLFEKAKGLTKEITIEVGKNKYILRYVNKVALNNTKEAPLVNFLECESFEIKGKKVIKKYFSWITDHKITENTAYEIMLGGRSRWKIENETFNTLKNQGYHFEHNFGHGKKYLHTIFALLMMLAFLIDQLQEATCGLFQAALKDKESKKMLWEMLRSFFHTHLIKSWTQLFKALGKGFKGSVFTFDTS